MLLFEFGDFDNDIPESLNPITLIITLKIDIFVLNVFVLCFLVL